MDAAEPAPRSLIDLPLITALLRFRYVVLSLATGVAAWGQHGRAGGEWRQYFVTGSELLFGVHHKYSLAPGGLHLYANYPDIQIGPLSLGAAAPLRFVGSDQGLVAGTVLMSLMIVVLLAVLERVAKRRFTDSADHRRIELTMVLGGLVVVGAWAELSSAFTHLDDALVMCAAIAALWAVAERRSVALGIALGLALAAKPWAVVLLPLMLAVRGRDRLRAVVIAAALTAAAWAPFVIFDPRTLSAATPSVDTDPASVLHLFGVPLGSGPGWVRLVQLSVALAVGLAAAATGRWYGVPLVGIAARMVLDPGVFPYYTSSLVLAALAWDLLRSRRPWPGAAVLSFLALDVAHVAVHVPEARAVLRLVVGVALVAWVFLAPTETSLNLTPQPL